MGYGSLKKSVKYLPKVPKSPIQVVDAALKEGIVGINKKVTKKFMRK